MTVYAHFSQRATCPPSAAVRQRSMADITFNWSRLTWPALAERHAAPWSRKISATSSAGGDIGRRLLRRLQGLPAPWLLARLRQQVERAVDAGDHAGGDAGVAGRSVEFSMTQERLDDTDIGAAFEQMRCKAVTQHMQRDVLPDPGGVDRLMEEAQELPCGHRLARPFAGEQPTFLQRCCRIVTRWSLPPPLAQQIEQLG